MIQILPPNGRVVAYIIGLENYVATGKIKRVDYARRDAQAFSEALKFAFRDREVDITTRIDDEVTRSVLEDELPYTIAGLHADDLFVFYFAGHGFYSESGNRLTAYDSFVSNLGGTTWSVRGLLTDPLSRSACIRALIFIDACAEKLDVPGRSVVRPINPDELKALVSARFHALFMSCEPNQSSYGSAHLGHGVWTHFLLRAFRGEAAEALGPGRLLTGDGLKEYLRRQVPVFAAKEVSGRVQRPYALIGSSGDFAIAEIPDGTASADTLSRPSRPNDLVAIGPNVVVVGEMLGSDGSRWMIGIEDFVVGSCNDLAKFVDDFDNVAAGRRYVLINEIGEGRMIAGRPAWKKTESGKIEFMCDVAPPAARITADRLPNRMAVSPETGDVFAERGAIARVSGMASLPQALQSAMSLIRGESFWDMDAGAEFSDYFNGFQNSPWLERLFMIETIRLASIARQPAIQKDSQRITPLMCVDRVRDLKLLETSSKDRRVNIKLALDLHGAGPWSGEIAVLVLEDEPLRQRRVGIAAQDRLIQPVLQPVERKRAKVPVVVSRGLQKPDSR